MAVIAKSGKAKASPIDRARKVTLDAISSALLRDTNKKGENGGTIAEAMQACREVLQDVAGYYALLSTDDKMVTNEDVAKILTEDLIGVVARDWQGYTPPNTPPGKRNRVEEFATFVVGKVSGGFRAPAKPLK